MSVVVGYVFALSIILIVGATVAAFFWAIRQIGHALSVAFQQLAIIKTRD